MPDLESKTWNYIQQRFGVERSDLEGFVMENRSGDIWITTGERDDESETEGFRFLRDTKHGFKPTTYALQFLGDRITENRVEVSIDELRVLLEGDMIQRSMEEKGYVALIHDGRVFGCGLYLNELVSSRVPKGRGGELLKVFED